MNDDLGHMDTLITLLKTDGGPGTEEGVASIVKEAFKRYTEDIRTDVLGNVFATAKGSGEGPRPTIMLAAHMDQIVLLVKAILPGGYLRVAPSGGFDARTLVGQEVLVHGRETLWGIIGSKPPHVTTAEERKLAPPLEELFIDVALPEEKAKELIRIGDVVTLASEPVQLLNRRISSKSLDNRTSIAILLECLRYLVDKPHDADVTMVATVQEEVGTRGAITAGYGVKPDVAIAVDVTWADMPGQPEDLSFKMDEGPSVVFGPNIHPKVFRALKDAAVATGSPWQMELSQGPTGTDGRAFQIAGDGIATGVVGIAIRYMHTAVETGSYTDIETCAKILAHFIRGIDASFVEGLTCY